MNTTLNPLLKIQNLRIGVRSSSGVKELVRGVDLDIRTGEFFALVGESGSGKTITAQSVLGFLPQPAGELISGTVFLNGKSLFELSEPEREELRGKEVGLVFQEPGSALDPLMKIGKQLKEALWLHGVSDRLDERIAEMVKRVELPERVLNAWPHELSGGMAQRTAIARSLVQDPEILLLDEPFGQLDELTREHMGQELLRIWAKAHKTILMVTHSIQEAVFLADRVLVLTHRPASLCLDLPIALPRPRLPQLRYTSSFAEFAGELHAALLKERNA